MWHPDMPLEYRNAIVTGDARELVKHIPDESVDIVFTSPPYNVGMNYEISDDSVPEDAFWQFQRDWVSETLRITVDRGRMYVVVSDKMLWRFRGLAEECGWRFHQLLVWCKPNIVNSTRIGNDWAQMAEWCLLFHKGKSTPMLAGIWGINTFNWIVSAATQSNFSGDLHKVHPAQMALQVAYTWLGRTPGNFVYDPFVGSGTTFCAAKRLGKSWVGFEMGTATAERARQRVLNTQPPFPGFNEAMQMKMDGFDNIKGKQRKIKKD